MPASPFDLNQQHAYRLWRDRKLRDAAPDLQDLIVEVNDPRQLRDSEYAALLMRCRRCNMAIYASRLGECEGTDIVRGCGMRFGLGELDHNRGAEADAVTALTVQSDALHAPYIPYTDKAIHWHTDGYYNALNRQNHGLLLHCVRRAAQGGANGLFDHEILYLLMRDHNPDWVRALMQSDAMEIPPHVVDGVELRPARRGPVFMVTDSGHLHMRFTMRKRHVHWKDDPMIGAALNWMETLLSGESPYLYRAILQPGWGLISNNILHDRSAFDDAADPARKRLLYRARYFDRIGQT